MQTAIRIGYKRARLTKHFLLGLGWLSVAFYQTYTRDKFDFTSYGWFILSLMYLSIFFYEKTQKYLTIKNGVIKLNTPFGEKLNLKEIKQIKVFNRKYTLISNEKELSINTGMINAIALN